MRCHSRLICNILERCVSALDIDLTFLNRYRHTYSLHCSPHVSYDTTWENLLKHQDISSLVITSFILITCMFDESVIL